MLLTLTLDGPTYLTSTQVKLISERGGEETVGDFCGGFAFLLRRDRWREGGRETVMRNVFFSLGVGSVASGRRDVCSGIGCRRF